MLNMLVGYGDFWFLWFFATDIKSGVIHRVLNTSFHKVFLKLPKAFHLYAPTRVLLCW
jgi:hypothetical protein